MGIVRKTKSVKILLKIFEETDEALSGVDLVKRFNKEMNKTTVYRILDRLEDEDILHSFQGKDGFKWYAKRKTSSSPKKSNLHPHFQCRDCGKTSCLNLDITIPNLPKHKIEHAEFLLIGQCEDCLS